MAQAGGWLKLWRAWLNHEVSRDAKAWLVLTHLLCRAAVTPRANRRLGYTLQPGECDETEEQLAQATGLTRKEVRGSLQRLGQYGTITKGQILGQRRNVITLVNWAFYNPPAENRAKDGADEGPTKGPTKGPRKGQERANPEELKKEKTTTPAGEVVELAEFVKQSCSTSLSARRLQGLVDEVGLDRVVCEAEARAELGERAFNTSGGKLARPFAAFAKAVEREENTQRTGLFDRWRRERHRQPKETPAQEAARWRAEIAAESATGGAA